MHTLILTIPPGPERPPLAEMLQHWIRRTELADAVAEVEEDPEAEQAVAVISRGDRRLELRLRHAEADLWRLDAATWLVHAGPSGPWTLLVGSVVLFGGLAISLGYLAWSNLTFWLGVATSAVMAALLTWVARRQERRHRLTPIETGGLADEVLVELMPVIRGDRRVKDVAST